MAFSASAGGSPACRVIRSGRTDTTTWALAGSGRVALRRYLDEAGMVAADNLNPQKARILLMLALARTPDIGEIRRMFTVY